MIGIKDQCFGVEIELTGITRAEAAEALAAYFETTPQRSYDNYDIHTSEIQRIADYGISQGKEQFNDLRKVCKSQV